MTSSKNFDTARCYHSMLKRIKAKIYAPEIIPRL